MTDQGGGLVSALYAPSTYRGTFGREEVEGTVTLETDYPFGELLNFRFDLPRAVRFPFSLRIPGWCSGASLHLNDLPLEIACPSATFVTVDRIFHPGDVLQLRLPMTPALREWPMGGVSVDFGPFALSLDIQERWSIDTGGTKGNGDARFLPAPGGSSAGKHFPDWEVVPGSPWNFALSLDSESLADDLRIERRPLSGNPWTQATSPIRCYVPARRVRDWEVDRWSQVEEERPREVAEEVWEKKRSIKYGDYTFTPQLPEAGSLHGRLEDSIETITLVPYGCTRLRLSIFPNGSRVAAGEPLQELESALS